jgi:hypothetical protein
MNPLTVQVPPEKEADATAKTVVVPARLTRTTGLASVMDPTPDAALTPPITWFCEKLPKVDDAVETPVPMFVTVAPALMVNCETHDTSQSPAVRLTLVELVVTFVVREVVLVVFVRISPTLPAAALLLVVVPTMPAVCDGVIAPVAVSAAVVTVPVNVGDASGARLVSEGCTWSARAKLADVPVAAEPSINGANEEAWFRTNLVDAA